MAEATHDSGIELARQFYKHHELTFRQLMAAPENAERAAAFSCDAFDDWAVAAGHMKMPVRAATEDEHGSLMFRRHRLRLRLNRAALKGEGLDRAYSVQARGSQWRIVLLERFVVEQPSVIVGGIRQCLERSERTAEQAMGFLDAQGELSDEDRLRCQMRLEMAQMSIFSGLQMMEMVIRGFDTDRPLNLKRLRRRMVEAMLRDDKKAKPVRRKRA
jgi:hypothetical protein